MTLSAAPTSHCDSIMKKCVVDGAVFLKKKKKLYQQETGDLRKDVYLSVLSVLPDLFISPCLCLFTAALIKYLSLSPTDYQTRSFYFLINTHKDVFRVEIMRLLLGS